MIKTHPSERVWRQRFWCNSLTCVRVVVGDMELHILHLLKTVKTDTPPRKRLRSTAAKQDSDSDSLVFLCMLKISVSTFLIQKEQQGHESHLKIPSWFRYCNQIGWYVLPRPILKLDSSSLFFLDSTTWSQSRSPILCSV